MLHFKIIFNDIHNPLWNVSSCHHQFLTIQSISLETSEISLTKKEAKLCWFSLSLQSTQQRKKYLDSK